MLSTIVPKNEIPDSIFSILEKEMDNLPIECPISGELMKHPVVTPCGHSFEEKSIQEWILRGHEKDEHGNCLNKCPQGCSITMSIKQLHPNYALIPFLVFAKKQRTEFKKAIETEKLTSEKLRKENELLKGKLAIISQVIQSDVLIDNIDKSKELSLTSAPNAFFTKPENKEECALPEIKKFIRPILSPEQQIVQDQNLELALFGRFKNHEDAKKALSAGANPDSNTSGQYLINPLLIAIAKDADITGLNLLIEYNANLNITNDAGDTALHWSSYLGNIDITASLLENGADPRIKNKKARNALEELREEGRTHPAIETLLERRIEELNACKVALHR